MKKPYKINFHSPILSDQNVKYKLPEHCRYPIPFAHAQQVVIPEGILLSQYRSTYLLWDTNIAIYYLQNQFPPDAEKFIDSIVLKSVPSISVITEIELLSWKSSSREDTLIIKQFISDSNVFELDQEIKNMCADIRKEYGSSARINGLK